MCFNKTLLPHPEQQGEESEENLVDERDQVGNDQIQDEETSGQKEEVRKPECRSQSLDRSGEC